MPDNVKPSSSMVRERVPTSQGYVLKSALIISILSVAACFCGLLLTIRSTVAAIPNELALTRSALVEQITDLRLDAISEIDQQANGIRKDATTQLSGIRREADRQLTGARGDIKEIGGFLSLRADALKDSLIGEIHPVLANAATLEKDAQDSLDDLYPDIRALIESADVATTQTAQTMQTVREAAPQVAAATVSVGKSAASIADSVDVEAKKLTQPQTRRQKLMSWLELMGKLGLRVL